MTSKPRIFIIYLLIIVSSSLGISQQLKNLQDQPVDSILDWVQDNVLRMDMDSVSPYVQMVLGKAKATNDPETLGSTHFSIAKIYRNLFIYDSIKHHVERALVYYNDIEDELLIADCYKELGYVAFNQLMFLTAEDYFMKAISIYEKFDQPSSTSNAYSLLAGSFELSGAHEEAISYGNRASTLAESVSDTSNLIWALTYVVPSYIASGQPEIALAKANESLNWLQVFTNPDPSQWMELYYYRGDAQLALGQLDSAVSDYNKALKLAQLKWEHSNPKSALFYTDGLAYIHQLRGNYTKAISMNRELLNYLYEVGEYENLVETHQRLAQCYKDIGNLEQALEQSQLAWHLSDSIKTLRSNALTSEVQRRYETAKQEETIRNQQLQLDREQRVRNLSLGITVLALLLLGLIFLNYRNNRRRNRELQVLNQSLSEKNQLLDERNTQNETLLKEIHHRVKNNLEIVSSLLELQASQLQHAQDKKAFESCQARIHSMGIIHEKLYSDKNLSSIEMRGYFDKLSQHILDSYSSNGLVRIECDMEPIDLDLDTAVPIGLIVNELVTNAIKYAFPNARTGIVKIQLQAQDSDKMELEVSDNGVGKDEMSDSRNGFGSQLIRLLTQQLGGTIREESDQGTKIVITLKKPIGQI